jgi:hypothetical protein
MQPENEYVATLIHAVDYEKQVNQIANVNTTDLLFVKRKELAMEPYELQRFPMADCTLISYKVHWALGSMIAGAAAFALLPLLIFFEIPAGTLVPIGALGIVICGGITLLRYPKRHRLTFVVAGKKFRWQSKAGDFQDKAASVMKVVAFAKRAGLYADSR